MPISTTELKAAYKNIEDQALNDFQTVAPLNDGYIVRSYQDAVEDILEYDNPDVLFAMLDGEDHRKVIWKILELEHEIPDIKEYLLSDKTDKEISLVE